MLLSENNVGFAQSIFIVESAELAVLAKSAVESSELAVLAKSAELAVLAESAVLKSFDRFGEMSRSVVG